MPTLNRVGPIIKRVYMYLFSAESSFIHVSYWAEKMPRIQRWRSLISTVSCTTGTKWNRISPSLDDVTIRTKHVIVSCDLLTLCTATDAALVAFEWRLNSLEITIAPLKSDELPHRRRTL